MATSMARIVSLWMQGYNFQGIANKLRLSPSTIRRHILEGSLVLPERDWVTASDVNIPHRSAVKWAEKGIVKRSPSGLYLKSELLQYYNYLINRECADYQCDEIIDDINDQRQFCDKHAYSHIEGSASRNPARGINLENVLEKISENPGITMSTLQANCRARSGTLLSALLHLEQKKLIVSYRGFKRVVHYRLTTNEEKAV